MRNQIEIFPPPMKDSVSISEEGVFIRQVLEFTSYGVFIQIDDFEDFDDTDLEMIDEHLNGVALSIRATKVK